VSAAVAARTHSDDERGDSGDSGASILNFDSKARLVSTSTSAQRVFACVHQLLWCVR
jgi:hypothetical protein